MKSIGIVASVLIGIAGPVLAASHAEVPDEVIEQCKANSSTSGMPGCLKHGALAIEMFEVYTREDVYGETGEQVIEACAERNEGDYATTMHCVRGAIENAVETRNLIGIDKIDDTCVAALADSDAVKVAMSEYAHRLGKWMGEYAYVDTMHYAFQGCAGEEEGGEDVAALGSTSNPKDKGEVSRSPEEDVVANEEESEDVAALGSTANPKDKGHETPSSGDFAAAECDLLEEIEGIIEAKSADELRTIAEKLDQIDGELSESGELVGLSEDAIETLESYNQENGMRDVFIVASMLHKNHPELWEELSEDEMVEVGPQSEGVDEEMAEAFMQAVFESAQETYREGCGAS